MDSPGSSAPVLINKFLGDFSLRPFRDSTAIIIAWQSPRGCGMQMCVLCMLIYEFIWDRRTYLHRGAPMYIYDPAKFPLSEAFNYIRRCGAVGINPLVIGYFQFPFARSYILQFRICFKLCALSKSLQGNRTVLCFFRLLDPSEHISLIRRFSGAGGGNMTGYIYSAGCTSGPSWNIVKPASREEICHGSSWSRNSDGVESISGQ